MNGPYPDPQSPEQAIQQHEWAIGVLYGRALRGIVTAPILMYDESKTHPAQPRKEGQQ